MGEERLRQRLSTTGTARPGLKRRRRENVSATSPQYDQVLHTM